MGNYRYAGATVGASPYFLQIQDDTPNQFAFSDQTNVALSTATESVPIVVTGFTSGAITISGDATSEYKINGGAYTSTAGIIFNNDTLTVRHTSSANFSTSVDTLVTIGDASDTFTTLTLPQIPIAVPAIYLPDDVLFIHWSVPVRAYPDIQLDYKITGYDWENRVLLWTLPVAPTGMTISSRGVISWVPSGQDGTHSVTVSMKPGSGTAITRSWTIDVDSSKFIFFATGGNDSTGDGTIGLPYLTMTKCLEEINGESRTVLGRGGSYSENFWGSGSPLQFETYTELTQVLIASYPDEQVLFNGGGNGPEMNFGEDYVVLDKINLDGCNANPFFTADLQAYKRCRAINSDWDDRQNCTGFFIHGGSLLDSCTAKDNYDRTPDITRNSSNFLLFNDKDFGAGSTYLIDCIDEGEVNSKSGFKEKHSGSTIQTHLHRCIMRSQRGSYFNNNFSSCRHSLLFSDQPIETVSGESDDDPDPESTWNKGALYQGNLIIYTGTGTAMSMTKFIWYTPTIDEGLYVKENTYLLQGGGDMMLYASQVNNNLGPPDNVGLRNLNIIDNNIYSPDETDLMQYTANNFLTLTEINALSLPVQSSGNGRIGNVPVTYDFTVADGVYRYTSDSQTLVKSGGSMGYTEIFNDPVEDSDFSGRGWYGSTTRTLSNDGAISGSTKSIEYKWLLGNSLPENGNAMRLLFTPTDNIYLSYYVKYLSGWQGSGGAFHPHEFHFLTDLAADQSGLSDTDLTGYIEQNALVPRLRLQDSQNIDENNIGIDLRSTSENRSVAGCNSGAPPSNEIGDCFGDPGDHENGLDRDGTGSISIGVWHKVEAFFKMNTISGSTGQADGVLRYWLDGVLEIDRTDVIMRTNQNATMKYKQLIIAPFMNVGSNGSPIEQTFLIDEITLGVE